MKHEIFIFFVWVFSSNIVASYQYVGNRPGAYQQVTNSQYYAPNPNPAYVQYVQNPPEPNYMQRQDSSFTEQKQDTIYTQNQQESLKQQRQQTFVENPSKIPTEVIYEQQPIVPGPQVYQEAPRSYHALPERSYENYPVGLAPQPSSWQPAPLSNPGFQPQILRQWPSSPYQPVSTIPQEPYPVPVGYVAQWQQSGYQNGPTQIQYYGNQYDTQAAYSTAPVQAQQIPVQATVAVDSDTNIQEILASIPVVKDQLDSQSHGKYLLVHENGTVERVDTLDDSLLGNAQQTETSDMLSVNEKDTQNVITKKPNEPSVPNDSNSGTISITSKLYRPNQNRRYNNNKYGTEYFYPPRSNIPSETKLGTESSETKDHANQYLEPIQKNNVNYKETILPIATGGNPVANNNNYRRPTFKPTPNQRYENRGKNNAPTQLLSVRNDENNSSNRYEQGKTETDILLMVTEREHKKPFDTSLNEQNLEKYHDQSHSVKKNSESSYISSLTNLDPNNYNQNPTSDTSLMHKNYDNWSANGNINRYYTDSGGHTATPGSDDFKQNTTSYFAPLRQQTNYNKPPVDKYSYYPSRLQKNTDNYRTPAFRRTNNYNNQSPSFDSATTKNQPKYKNPSSDINSDNPSRVKNNNGNYKTYPSPYPANNYYKQNPTSDSAINKKTTKINPSFDKYSNNPTRISNNGVYETVADYTANNNNYYNKNLTFDSAPNNKQINHHLVGTYSDNLSRDLNNHTSHITPDNYNNNKNQTLDSAPTTEQPSYKNKDYRATHEFSTAQNSYVKETDASNNFDDTSNPHNNSYQNTIIQPNENNNEDQTFGPPKPDNYEVISLDNDYQNQVPTQNSTEASSNEQSYPGNVNPTTDIDEVTEQNESYFRTTDFPDKEIDKKDTDQKLSESDYYNFPTTEDSTLPPLQKKSSLDEDYLTDEDTTERADQKEEKQLQAVYIDTETDTIDQQQEVTVDSSNLKNIKKPIFFLPDKEFWDKLYSINETLGYDNLSIFNVEVSEPIIEKTSKTCVFENGPSIEEITKTIWKHKDDELPREIVMTTIIRNPSIEQIRQLKFISDSKEGLTCEQ